MDLNHCCLLILVLVSHSLCSAIASNSEIDSDFSQQRRLFNKLGSDWTVEAVAQDETPFDDSDGRVNPELRFLEELFKSRQRPLVVGSESDQSPEGYNYENEREIESSIPHGVQNVFSSVSGRLTRSKNRHKSTFQSLCPSKRETVFLNLDPDFEYRPDYYEEVRCAHHGTHGGVHSENKIQSAVCSEAGFSCIQLNGTLFLTRRARGEGCWESETRAIPAGCECMWPKHQLGDIMAHH